MEAAAGKDKLLICTTVSAKDQLQLCLTAANGGASCSHAGQLQGRADAAMRGSTREGLAMQGSIRAKGQLQPCVADAGKDQLLTCMAAER
eukprot:10622-Chlamydomonas_euryale.AAC.1